MWLTVERANWPIQQHWIRVIAFASAWSGLNPAAPAEYNGDSALLNAALKGMDWWFSRDYTNPGCTSQGGKPYVHSLILSLAS